MSWLIALIALASGAANPFQAGTNAELNKQLHNPLWATVSVYLTGLLGVLLVQLVLRQAFPSTSAVRSVPWWAWLGGLISIASTVAGLTLAQRLGSGTFTALTLTASVVTSVLLDQFGLIGFKQHPTSPLRAAGCALLVVGVWLVARF